MANSIEAEGASVAEVALAGQHYRGAGCVHSVDDLSVADRAARLDHRRDPRLETDFDPVGERKEGVGRHHRALDTIACPLDGDLGRLNPAHLTSSYAYRGEVPRDHDGVGLDVLDSEPCEIELFPFLGGGLAPAADAERVAVEATAIPGLGQKSTWDRPHVVSLHSRPPDLDYSQVLASGQQLERFVGVAGRQDDVGLQGQDLFGGRLVQRPVEG